MARSSLAELTHNKRCAIYTRKSTTQGLERELNTLEAQRAICSAYITSQKHKGWNELARHYDDGGYSGASLHRPQLQQLLADVEQGLVDVVVVYKLDRMTRTLLDFVRLADFFERYGVVFVSITQNFDTADSMGRLILNILLTFAQFEREMCSDRLRDKVRIAKQAGRWAGGPAPIGYDLIRHRLHVNETEAAVVRQMFHRYIETGNLTLVFKELRAADTRGKKWKTRAGHVAGGRPITKALVFHVLGNPIYLGKIRHRNEMYEGLHAPIVDRETWDKVQEIRARQARIKAGRNKEHILTDLLFDCFGRPMSVNRTFIEGRSKIPSRTYVSRQSAWAKRQNLKRLRARAEAIEDLVVTTLASFLSDREQIRSMLLSLQCHDADLDRISKRCQFVGHRLAQTRRDRLRLALRALIARIELSLDRVKIVIRCGEAERYLKWDGVGIFKPDRGGPRPARTHLIDVPATAIQYGRLLAMPIEARKPRSGPHPAPGIKRLIKDAREFQALVDAERDKSLPELAAEVNQTAHRFARVLRLNYLAPDIVTGILDGAIPPGLTQTKLVQAPLPMDWALQRKLLGFPARPQLEGGE
ncbi:recombinase family protein [Sphingomonas sp. URHD0057]|uniref:recombinase family protein n=1 Tax=Sphingomonas sp. URHD0057 TaxID=1380389 RepID=UPI00048FD134|nr:recombinase family protein [Sphingomonas sp. URHD0057]